MFKNGLSEEEVLILKQKFGENSLPVEKGVSWFSILLSQFKSPLIYILLAALVVYIYLKEYMDVALIGIVVILNSIMGFFQEYNAQKTLAALKNILKPKALVIRNGERKEIDIKKLVPGDLVVLTAGNKVPADGKMVEGTSLLVSEAILTGEEEAVKKTINEKENILFMGTTVIWGRGIMEILKIGKETEIGKIGISLAEIKDEATPLQKKLENFSKGLAKIILLICTIIFLVGIFRQENIFDMVQIAVILAVAAVPEGLPIAITIILTLGMRRILKRNGLVKKLLSIETLGATSVICTDKTGTLTKGIMQVVKTDFTDKRMALLALTMNNDQKSGLEIALLEYVNKEKDRGFDHKEVFNSSVRIYEEPFDSEKKYMMTLSVIENKEVAFITGAPEIVLNFCDISVDEKNKVLANIENLAGEGLRIIGITVKEKGDLKEKTGFSWLGLVAIEDPLREEAKEMILMAQEAGIKVKIVTGDYLKTAEKIANNLGFKLKPENIIDGIELEKISDEELKERIEGIVLFARVTPHQKLKIVKALQENGEIVAMTGDGVNDSPALKKANIGIAVGEASDVAKEAADLILLDSNFKTIVAACEEGRLIFSNIKKVVGYVLSNSFVEIFLIFGAMIMGLPAPLTILQILWIHLICDGPPDIILGFEPKEKSIMKEKPQNLQKEEILPNTMRLIILSVSLITGLLTLGFFWYFYRVVGDLNLARTVSFVSVAAVDLVYILSFKNLKKLIIHSENFFKNKYLFLAIIYGFALIFIAIYMPFFNRTMETVPLNLYHWFLAFSVAIISTLVIEGIKVISNRKNIH